MSFIGVYLALLALTTPLPSHAHALPSGPSLLVALASLAVAASVCWSRVYLGHHTPLQVTAGALLGGLCAIVAFLVYPTDLALTMERAVGDALLLSLDAWRDRNPRHLAGLKEIYRTVL
jgi:membrane-associated phospholipid phosphatase